MTLGGCWKRLGCRGGISVHFAGNGCLGGDLAVDEVGEFLSDFVLEEVGFGHTAGDADGFLIEHLEVFGSDLLGVPTEFIFAGLVHFFFLLCAFWANIVVVF